MIALFAGRGFVSRFIMFFESLCRFRVVRDWLDKDPEYSHIGRVVKMTQELYDMLAEARRPDGKKRVSDETLWEMKHNIDKLWLLESTTFEYDGVKQSGVRAVLWSKVEKSYNGRIDVRYIVGDATYQQTIDLYQFICDTYGDPYEKHAAELAGAATPWHVGSSNTNDWFCSEWVYASFIAENRVDEDTLANEFSPQHFEVGGAVDRELKYSETPVCLGEIVRIK